MPFGEKVLQMRYVEQMVIILQNVQLSHTVATVKVLVQLTALTAPSTRRNHYYFKPTMSEVLHTNIRGLVKNFDEISTIIKESEPLFFFLSETFLSSTVPTEAISIDGYGLI